MPAIGFGLLWTAYTVGLMGYCTWKGYDVTWSQLIRPSKALTAWPPPLKAAPAPPSGSGGVSLPNPGQIPSLLGEVGKPIGPVVQGGLNNVAGAPPARNMQ